MFNKLRIYIDNNLEINDRECSFKFKRAENCDLNDYLCDKSLSVDSFIDNNKDENKFHDLLFKYIDNRGLKDSDVYNKVHIDRRLFSKIRSDIEYHPSKETIILLALSLRLNIDELVNLLESASYSLPKNNYYDLIIRFCFIEGIYDIRSINDMLLMYNCKMFNY